MTHYPEDWLVLKPISLKPVAPSPGDRLARIVGRCLCWFGKHNWRVEAVPKWKWNCAFIPYWCCQRCTAKKSYRLDYSRMERTDG